MKKFLMTCIWFHLLGTMAVLSCVAISLVTTEPTIYEPDSVLLAIVIYQVFQLVIDVIFIGREMQRNEKPTNRG